MIIYVQMEDYILYQSNKRKEINVMDFSAILDTVMNKLVDYIVQIDFAEVLDKIAGFVIGLIK